MAKDEPPRWTSTISGNMNDPNGNKIVIVRHGGLPRILLEIDAPGILSAGEERRPRGRAVIQAALTALQQALDTPRALAGFGPD